MPLQYYNIMAPGISQLTYVIYSDDVQAAGSHCSGHQNRPNPSLEFGQCLLSLYLFSVAVNPLHISLYQYTSTRRTPALTRELLWQ